MLASCVMSFDQCAEEVTSACLRKKIPIEALRSMDICNSNYGGFTTSFPESLEQQTQKLIAQHLQASMQYLLIATRFNDWTIDRKGFHAFYSKMSDDAFNDAVSIMQHMNMRGGALDKNFNVMMPEEINYKVSELESLSLVLAIEKDIVKKTLLLINNASNPDSDVNQADGELALFLAEQVSGNHAPRIKKLASHVNNLGQAIAHGLEKNKDPSYVVFLYDTQFM